MLQKAKKSRYNNSDYNNIEYNMKGKNDNKNTRKGKIVLFYIVFLIVVGLVLITYIGQLVRITYLNYDIEKLEQQLQQVNEKKQQLNLKVAQNTSLSRIEQIARKRLHMVEPEQMEVVVLHSNDSQQQQETVSSGNDKQIYFLQVFNNLWQNFNTVRADSPN